VCRDNVKKRLQDSPSPSKWPSKWQRVEALFWPYSHIIRFVRYGINFIVVANSGRKVCLYQCVCVRVLLQVGVSRSLVTF